MIDLHGFEQFLDLTWRTRNGNVDRQAITIYVENSADALLYQNLIGPMLGEWIRFSEPPDSNGRRGQKNTSENEGWKAALSACRKARADANPVENRSFYCLLDGEEMTRSKPDGHHPKRDMFDLSSPLNFATYQEAFESAVLTASDENWRGVLFLDCWELENMYLLHTDAIDFIADCWTQGHNAFGTKLMGTDLWKVLQRCLYMSAISTYAKIIARDFEQDTKLNSVLGNLAKQANNTDHALSICMTTLRNDVSQQTAKHFADLKDHIKYLGSCPYELLSLDKSFLRICDGKEFFKFCFAQERTNNLNRFASQLVMNGFATKFQVSLIANLVGDMRPTGGPGEFRFGTGKSALYARLRSTLQRSGALWRA